MPGTMSTKDRMAGMLAAEDGPAALAELGFIPLAESAKAGIAGAEQARAGMIDVAELCQLGGLSTDQTVALLKTDKIDAASARTQIQQIRADKSKETVIKSTITPLAGDGKHPLISSCEQLAGRN